MLTSWAGRLENVSGKASIFFHRTIAPCPMALREKEGSLGWGYNS